MEKKAAPYLQLIMLALCAACALMGAIAFLGYSWRRQRSYDSIPGKKHSFYNILGDLIYFDVRKNLRRQMLVTLIQWMKWFPNEQLIVVWLSYYPILLIMKWEAVKEVLKSIKFVDKPFPYDYIKPIAGNGLITSEKVKWKSRRKLLNPCFHSDVLRNYKEIFNRMTKKLVKTLQNETKKDFTYVADPLTLCAFDAVCESIFGTKILLSENEKIKVSNSLKRAESIIMSRTYTAWMWPDFIFWKTKTGKDMAYHTNIVHTFIKDMIEEKKKRYLNGERTVYNGKHKALIDVLLEKHVETREFSEEDIIEEAVTFMGAGHDTIAMAAMWAIYMIGHYPEIQAKLHEEIDRVFGDDRERDITEQDIKDLQYMDCVLKECNRIYPAVPAVGRQILEETTICGSTIPKDTTCIVFMYFLHRDEKIFPDAEKFDPERFSPENRVNIPEYAYIPFSAGPRNCIGFKFAEMELGYIMSSVLRNFKVESLNKVEPVTGISLHPSEPIRIKFSSRDAHKT